MFNDLQIVQLYATYGRTLTAVLRGADGIAIPTHEVGDLDEVPATFTSPLYEAIEASWRMAAPAASRTTTTSRATAASRCRCPLRPSMAYTLDIEAQPVPAPPAGKPVVPLFRRHFRTGRFTSLEALVGELKARPLLHRRAHRPVTGLTLGAAATDLQIETALTAAGLAAARRARPRQPDRALAAASERATRPARDPARRRRAAVALPRRAPAGGRARPARPAYQRIVPGRESSLQLTATGPVAGFVRSASGTRTLVMLNDAAWPTPAPR